MAGYSPLSLRQLCINDQVRRCQDPPGAELPRALGRELWAARRLVGRGNRAVFRVDGLHVLSIVKDGMMDLTETLRNTAVTTILPSFQAVGNIVELQLPQESELSPLKCVACDNTIYHTAYFEEEQVHVARSHRHFNSGPEHQRDSWRLDSTGSLVWTHTAWDQLTSFVLTTVVSGQQITATPPPPPCQDCGDVTAWTGYSNEFVHEFKCVECRITSFTDSITDQSVVVDGLLSSTPPPPPPPCLDCGDITFWTGYSSEFVHEFDCDQCGNTTYTDSYTDIPIVDDGAPPTSPPAAPAKPAEA
jgi:hypothetical protein